MTPLRRSYLALAILGAIWPMAHLLSYLLGEGGSLPGMVGLWIANDATRGLTADLLVSALVVILWVLAEYRLRRDPLALIAIPATLTVGVSFGLPLYLFLRSRSAA
ncbi:MAG: DUF2834 domain-containing protein [Maritimibacter sp.]